MYVTRARAVKEGKELIFLDRSIKGQHKMRVAIKEKIKVFENYLKDLKNTP